MSDLKPYQGCIPPCGVFCGGCPVYVRDRKPCPGAQISQRCAGKCCRFFTCARQKGAEFCHQCDEYPCPRLKRFARSWTKYGQDLLDNQKDLQMLGTEAFLEQWNERAKGDDTQLQE